MAYTPKNWVCGETITNVGLNNIEEGIQEALDCCSGGIFVANSVYASEATTLDKTFTEISNALKSKTPSFVYGGGSYFDILEPIARAYAPDVPGPGAQYEVWVLSAANYRAEVAVYSSATADGILRLQD